MRHAVLALLAALALALLPTASLAKPALWVVKDADTTLYLFGTIHLLPKNADWHYDALDHALAQSDALVVEITDDNPANMTALVLRLGIDAAHPLSSLLSSGDFHRLELAARKAGLPGTTALNVMRPWLATLTLTLAPLTKAGLDPARGVDRQLREMMTKAGKPGRALETAEQQIHFLADMPTAMQLDMLRQTVHEADHASIELQALLMRGRPATMRASPGWKTT